MTRVLITFCLLGRRSAWACGRDRCVREFVSCQKSATNCRIIAIAPHPTHFTVIDSDGVGLGATRRPPAPKAVARSPFTNSALSSRKPTHQLIPNQRHHNLPRNPRALARTVKCVGWGAYPHYCLRPIGRRRWPMFPLLPFVRGNVG